MNIIKNIAAASLGLFILSSAASAQEGLVVVVIEDNEVLNELIDDTNVAVPVNVQVGIGVAAQVCGIAANVLTQQTEGGGTACTLEDAGNATPAFKQALRQQVG